MAASNPSARVSLIGIAGGTGAGKTHVAKAIQEELGKDKVTIIPHDAYYRDRSHLPPPEREKINYDHPDAFENDLLLSHLNHLKEGEVIERPIYDFKTHTRKLQTVTIKPSPIIIVEGIMILTNKAVRELLDYKIYIDASPDIRLLKRLERDIVERGRTFGSVKQQYLNTVRPMHLEFVEPSKKYADLMITNRYNRDFLDQILDRLKDAVSY